jgi:hypothetical protein
MSCIRSCYDKGNTNFGHEDCTTCIHGDRPPKPKREWVGLTDEERHEIREWQRIQEELGPVWSPMMMYLYLAIEAKLKEKNTQQPVKWSDYESDGRIIKTYPEKDKA